MKKKTKKRLRLALSLALLAAFLAFWIGEKFGATTRHHWRVPVSVTLPKLPDLSEIPNISDLPDVPDIHLPEAEKAAEGVWEAIKDHPLALDFEEKLPPEERLTQPPPPLPLPLPPSAQAPSPTPPAVQQPPAAALPHGAAPRIALIIDDMGLMAQLSARAVRLPGFVTLSYLPYAPRVEDQVKASKARGHEIMLHLPMQPMGSANPGPGALMVGQDEETWQRLIMEALSSFDGFAGVNNHMGSRFTSDAAGMRLVAEALAEEGVFFVDSRTSPRSLALEAMRAAGVRTAARDIFLDDTVSPAAIRAELARLEGVARRSGQAVAIGHPHAQTLEALEEWIPQAQTRGLRFVPASAVVKVGP